MHMYIMCCCSQKYPTTWYHYNSINTHVLNGYILIILTNFKHCKKKGEFSTVTHTYESYMFQVCMYTI